MKEFIEKLISRLEEELPLYVGKAKEIVNQLAEEYKSTDIITDFLQYARDNADNYDTNEGWSLSDLIDLSIKYSEKYINTSTDTSTECCEWHPLDKETNVYKSGCEKQSFYDGNPTESMYEFCPYCGKKIKVVEK